MWLSDTSVKRPVFATVISLALVAFGVLSFNLLPLREYPDVTPPVVSISTSYPGASSDVIESRVTTVIEDQISGIEGVKSVRFVEHRWQLAHQHRVRPPSRHRRRRERRSRPGLAGRALVAGGRASAGNPQAGLGCPPRHVHQRAQLGDEPHGTHRLHRAIHRRPLRGDPRRCQCRRTRGRVRQCGSGWTGWRSRPGTSPSPTSSRHCAAKTWNSRRAGSRPRTAKLTVRLARGYQSAEDFRELVIARGEDGHLVRLGEVATVEVAPLDHRSIFRANGLPTVSIGIIKQSKANTLETLEQVGAEIEKLNEAIPDHMRITTGSDGLGVSSARRSTRSTSPSPSPPCW